MTRVLVTGVRGKTGAPLAQLLVARPGLDVLGGSSDPTTVTLEGVQPTAFSWDDASTWAAATHGVDAVYVVRPDRADAPELIGALLTALAPETRVVLLSERNADSLGPGGWAARTEHVVRAGDRPWTVLRPSWFMQVLTDQRFFLGPVVEEGELAFSSGGASLAWIDARDIAAVAERALLDDGHEGQVYELTGPESLTLSQVADQLSTAAGHRVTHREITIDEALDGLSGFERDLTLWTFERVHAGSFTPVTDTVERVTGRRARTLEAFLADSATELRRG
ncbi:NAD(P)H-binding protein [Cellulomonas carbonis]|uniref:Nucleoside-diphosphate sugar epimerase n=1 Tax=Cellulomonas carbonis T26 TaxID=947969 RepID=A0A0A0BZM2_9CELL|nr:NAD(P)H-binding protein [Cellulomonas carbonis]KGM12619.1 nucleoside-diphosphate sugar epimerase [Cellulomonas carbonis T26]GGC06050.1 NmrA family protein [Cellulomonas carbonis]